jgi:hypothetical protein
MESRSRQHLWRVGGKQLYQHSIKITTSLMAKFSVLTDLWVALLLDHPVYMAAKYSLVRILDSTVSGQGPVAGYCECGEEPSGSCATELVS